MKRRSQFLQTRHHRGFVLVLTLWVLVIVTVSVAYFAERISQAVQLAQQSRQNTQAMIDMANTRSELMYRLGTTTLTEYGLGRGGLAVVLDNRNYQGEGNTLIRIQDNRGLLNLNISEDERLRRLLGIIGISADQRGPMVDALRDYTDEDNLRRLNGAEQAEYLSAGLAPPTNTNLVTPWQARSVIGWRAPTQLWQNARLAEITTTGRVIGMNPNTAPAETLATLPGITDEIAKRIIVRRGIMPILDVNQLAAITLLPPLQLDDDIIMLPSNSLRITQYSEGLPWSLQYNLTLTPRSALNPWRIDYYGRVSGQKFEGVRTNVPPLPVRTTTQSETSPL
jgi:general secretion pathway protein K